jgi:hypothetical protein
LRSRWHKVRAWRWPAKRPRSPNRASRRVPEAGDFLQLEGGAGRDRSVERPLQPHPAPLLLGLPTSRACHPAGHRTAATHTSRHAVVSLNSVQNPGQTNPTWAGFEPPHVKQSRRHVSPSALCGSLSEIPPSHGGLTNPETVQSLHDRAGFGSAGQTAHRLVVGTHMPDGRRESRIDASQPPERPFG